jgi:hypothetical protein
LDNEATRLELVQACERGTSKRNASPSDKAQILADEATDGPRQLSSGVSPELPRAWFKRIQVRRT